MDFDQILSRCFLSLSHSTALRKLHQINWLTGGLCWVNGANKQAGVEVGSPVPVKFSSTFFFLNAAPVLGQHLISTLRTPIQFPSFPAAVHLTSGPARLPASALDEDRRPFPTTQAEMADPAGFPLHQARFADATKIPMAPFGVEMLVVIYLTALVAYVTYGLRMYSKITSRQTGIGKDDVADMIHGALRKCGADHWTAAQRTGS